METLFPSIQSEKLLASNTVAEKGGIKDSDNHEGPDHYESDDFNWCG